MKLQYVLILIVVALFTGCSTLAGKNSTDTSSSELVSSLTQKLGVTNEQATGGAGAILSQAKEKLSPADYAKISKAMPETESLVKAAPKNDGMTDKLGGMASSLNSGNESAGGLGALAGSFSKLGLSPEMAGKFMPIVLQYANSKGGSSVSGLLQSAFQ